MDFFLLSAYQNDMKYHPTEFCRVGQIQYFIDFSTYYSNLHVYGLWASFVCGGPVC